MKHSFDSFIAKEYGIEEAIIIDHLFFWINKNVANGKHFYEGRHWTYNSVSAFSELFPYMSSPQISRRLNNLIEKGLLVKGNYNQSSYDRTAWYAFTDIAISILQKCGYHFTKMQNGFNEIVKPIPDNNTDTIPDNKQIILDEIDSIYNAYPSKCPTSNRSTGKTSKNKGKIKSLLKTEGFELLQKTIEYYLADCKRSKTYLKNFGTFLNNLPDKEIVLNSEIKSSNQSKITVTKPNKFNIL